MDNTVTDMLGKTINVGDFVVFANNIYQVKKLDGEKLRGRWARDGNVRIMLINPSKTTKPVLKRSDEMVVVPAGDVLFKLIKQ